jgi:hypothetical protein
VLLDGEIWRQDTYPHLNQNQCDRQFAALTCLPVEALLGAKKRASGCGKIKFVIRAIALGQGIDQFPDRGGTDGIDPKAKALK